MGFTIKFDTSTSGVSGDSIFVQIVTADAGAWDFSTNSWNTDKSLSEAPSSTITAIGTSGVTLTDFTGGGKIYISIGNPTDATYLGGGKYRSAVYNSLTWGGKNVFDKIEFGGDANSIVNQSAVTFYSLPLQFEIAGTGSSAGYINSRSAITSELASLMKSSPWKDLIVKYGDSDNTIAAINPAAGFKSEFGPNSTILDTAIAAALPKGKTLYVGTNKINGQTVQEFTTDAKTGAITSTDGGDTANIALDCFTTFAVFTNAPYDPQPASAGIYNLFGAISAQILRGLSFENNDPAYFKDLANFPFTNDPFAKVLHNAKNSKDGLAYAMGYDDTGAADFSSSLPRPGGDGINIKLGDCSDLNTILGLS